MTRTVHVHYDLCLCAVPLQYMEALSYLLWQERHPTLLSEKRAISDKLVCCFVICFSSVKLNSPTNIYLAFYRM